MNKIKDKLTKYKNNLNRKNMIYIIFDNMILIKLSFLTTN